MRKMSVLIFKKITVFVWVVFIAFTTIQCAPANHSGKSATAGRKKVVFIAGAPSHGKGEHEFKGGCTLLVKALNENTTTINAVMYDGAWPADSTVFNDAAAVVIYSDGGAGHMVLPHMALMNRLAQKGVGIVMIHYAVEVPKGEAGNNVLRWIGGYFETYWSVNPFWNAEFKTLPKHAVTQGVRPFSAKDEWYYHMRFAEGMKGVTPILTTVPPKTTLGAKDGSHDGNAFVRAEMEKGTPQIMAWTFERPNGGRGFGFTGAHMHINWGNDDYRKLVLNAIAWAAHVPVPKEGITSSTPTEAELKALQNTVK